MTSSFALAFASLLLAEVAHAAQEFPPFLPGAGEFPPDVRAEIVRVWSGHTLTRTVDVHVGLLRQKLEQDAKNPRHFLTVRGFGYKFVEKETSRE